MSNLFPLNKVLAGAALAALAFSAPVLADEESEQKGYEIAERSDNSDNGFGDSKVTAVMTLQNAAGQSTTREMEFTTLERESHDVGDKSLVLFRSPRDVEGTALLSHAKITGSDDQWLYLPALGRVRRISSANKSGPFVGSEFAFEDFTSLELKKYTYDFIEQVPLEMEGGTFTVDVVKRFPAYENSGYDHQISYVDVDNLQVRRVEFFDRRGDHLKTLDLLDYREYGEGIWRAQTLTMVNHRTNKRTTIAYSEYEFNAGLDNNDFVKGVLDRTR